MRPISRRTALASAAVLGSATLLSSCGGGGDSQTQDKIDNPDANINPEGLPVVKEKTTIKFMSGRPPTTAESWDNVSCVTKMEEMTNVNIDWGLVPLDGVGEKRNLAMASGDYPEVLYRTSVGGGDIAKYGEQGVFIPMNDLIEKYMPNLKGIMDKIPDVRKAMTFPDGNMYSLPQIYDAKGMLLMIKGWVRKDWLDSFGMDVPTTLDEYEAYLEAVTSKNPSGNGKSNEIGIGVNGIGDTIGCLAGTFGICNRGSDNKTFDVDPADESKIRFIPTSDGYRELLTYLNRLYGKGLIQEDVFATEAGKVNALGSEGLIGSTFTQTPQGFYGKEGENYVAFEPLKKEASDETPYWAAVRPNSVALGQFVMTDKNEHPIETARWADQWFGPEGSAMFFMGVEGVSFHEVDGEYELMPEVTEGKTIDEALKPHALYMGGRYPGYATDEVFRGVENTPQAIEGAEVVEPFALKEVWSSFTFTAEESLVTSSIGTDISKHVSESQAAFITGDLPLDQWDSYVSKFEQMGLAEYVQVNQAAMDRRNAI